MLVTHYVSQVKLIPISDSARSSAGMSAVRTTMGKIAFQTYGPDAGQIILMVHGFSVQSVVFHKNAFQLAAAGYRVIVFDHFGRGLSDRPQTKYDLDFYDNELITLLEALQIRNPIDLVGFSLGGGIAANFAHKHPDQVRNLLLIAPVGISSPRYLLNHALAVPGLGEWIAAVPMKRQLIRSLEKDFLAGDVSTTAFSYYKEQFNYLGTSQALLSTLRSFPLGGLEQVYRQLSSADFPVLVLWGQNDRVVPFKLMAKLKGLMPQAVYHEIGGAGHGLPYTHAEEVNAALLRFLSLD